MTLPDGGLGAETEHLLEMEARGSAPARPRASDLNLRLLVSASAVHLLNDFYIAFLAPLLPLVVVRFHLSLTLAGLLATILNTSSAMSQPLFGALADRMRRRIFVVVGPLLSASGMGLMGLAPSYGLLIVLLFIAGTGTAAFHPQGASTAGEASGRRKGSGLSLFVAGGELGYALGPLVIAVIVASRGLDATWTVALPGVIVSLLLARSLPPVRELPSRARARSLHTDLAGVLRPLIVLWFIVVLRSIVITSYQTFIPLLLTQRGGSLVAGGAAAFLFGGIGAIGGFSGGMFSDRIGRRRILVLSLLLSAPLLLAFIRGHGAWAYVFLAAGGITVYLSAAVTIVMAQELLPHRAGVASSVVMGLAWGTAGLALTGVGALADAVGLPNALALLLLLFVPALGAVRMLPKALDTPAEQPR